jgi:hypothetical protein
VTAPRAPILLCLLPATVLATGAPRGLPAADSEPGTVAQAGGRLRPPAFVTCERNLLTSYTGRAVALDRGRDRTVLRLETDEGTRESVTVRHPGASVRPFFHLAGEPFSEAEWSLILEGGRLRPGARATAWLCSDGSNPQIDWERPE